MSSWETDCRSWGFVGSRNFSLPHINAHTYKETQCEVKRLFSQQTSPFVYVQPGVILDAFCRGFFFSVKRLMKELTITLAGRYQVMKYEFTLFAGLSLERRNQQRQTEGDVTPLATVSLLFIFFKNPRGEVEEMSFTADICWIPHRANDIMQRFLNKLYPAWGESER